jgi:hypothetical protein
MGSVENCPASAFRVRSRKQPPGLATAAPLQDGGQDRCGLALAHDGLRLLKGAGTDP